MSTYKELVGKFVTSYSSDPTAAYAEGQIWYNTTSNTFKTSVPVFAWGSGGAYPVAIQSGAGFGTQTAAVGAGGTPPGNVGLKTFEYDGSSWTAGNNMSRTPTGSPYLSAYIAGSGTLTAGWAAGGGYPTQNNLTENYDGTTWTASGTMPANRRGGNCTGPQTAGLYFAGNAPGVQAGTYEYNGSSWTNGGDLNTARTNAGGSGPTGSQTAALSFAGNIPGFTNKTEEYNGSSWTEVNAFPDSRSYVGYAGSQTDAIGFTGYTSGSSAVTTTTAYDGTNWSSKPAMSTGRLMYHTNAGTGSSALAFGGEAAPGVISQTEEFSAAGSPTVKTITSS